MHNKIIRSICIFTDNPTPDSTSRLKDLVDIVNSKGYEVQTMRLCVPNTISMKSLKDIFSDSEIYLNVGSISHESALEQFNEFTTGKDVNFTLDLSSEDIDENHGKLLFDIIKTAPAKTFSFAYVFNHVSSSPYFPSANYERNGFSIGLQSTDLSANCNSLEEWFSVMSECWDEINSLFSTNSEFLGIDSSVAPLFTGDSSFINFIKRLGLNFSESVVSDTYMRITKFIKEANPNPVGLCGIMFPCLEDYDLTDEYTLGNFNLERNIFLSLHSGLGIDTYPIGINEKIENVVIVLKTIQGLSNKYSKPLAVRFVSDGKAKIGEKSNFNNPFLKDVVVRSFY